VAMEGLLDACPEAQWFEAVDRVRAAAQQHLQAIEQRIAGNQALTPEDRQAILEVARASLRGLFDGAEASPGTS